MNEVSDVAKHRYIVGIDLGTTHCCVAYAPLQSKAPQIQLFEIEQLVVPGQTAKRALLPSARYHCLPEELENLQNVLPWQRTKVAGDIEQFIVGEYAQQRGGETVGRLLVSAKSWLSHPKVDRSAAILPWGSAEEVPKVSPIVASASYLAHIRDAWNLSFPATPLEAQKIVITVPASFDDVARIMTLQAASMVGLEKISLLEEPQAACYNWYWSYQKEVTQALKQVQSLLVCDIGGGTTDFSLIEIKVSTKLSMKRVAVGDHLMLGGDNLDLALAKHVEAQLIDQGRLERMSAGQMTQLMQQTKRAKEILLSKEAPDQYPVTVLGKGGRLFAKSHSMNLAKDLVERVVIKGFFPLVEQDQELINKGSAVVEFGLPYARDPALTRHLSAFLNKQGQRIPDAVLFNGGVLKSERLQQRLLTQLQQWKQDRVMLLPNAEPDLAVAKGAVVYALAEHGLIGKISSALPRSYFLMLNSECEQALEQAVCVLPKGSEVGVEVPLIQHQFMLRLGQPVQFKMITSSEETNRQVGELVSLEYLDYQPLPPLVVKAEVDSAQQAEIDVMLAAQATEYGTLQLRCESSQINQDAAVAAGSWLFHFETREMREELLGQYEEAKLHSQLSKALEMIERCFGKSDAKFADQKSVKVLRPSLERLLGKREDWQAYDLRTMADRLLLLKKKRRRSSGHEKIWFWLCGFSLRPGFGFVEDENRMIEVLPLFEQNLQYVKEQQNWSAWWVFWRRVSGGLLPEGQLLLYQRLKKLLNRQFSKGRGVKEAEKNPAFDDAIRLLGSLEHVPLSLKEQVGVQILRLLERDKKNLSLWWSLGRLAAREPLYAGFDAVLPAQMVEPWVQKILEKKLARSEAAYFALVQMGRLMEDRVLDVSGEVREHLLQELERAKVPKRWLKSLSSKTSLSLEEQKLVVGESLPLGLRLLTVGENINKTKESLR